MHSVLISFVIVAIFWLSVVNGDCCSTVQDVIFSIEGASCGAVGGHGEPEECRITLCNDGYVSKTSYCGKGPCDGFGCKCENGCLQGDFSNSFLENFEDYNIEILEATWRSGVELVGRRFSEAFWSFFGL